MYQAYLGARERPLNMLTRASSASGSSRLVVTGQRSSCIRLQSSIPRYFRSAHSTAPRNQQSITIHRRADIRWPKRLSAVRSLPSGTAVGLGVGTRGVSCRRYIHTSQLPNPIAAAPPGPIPARRSALSPRRLKRLRNLLILLVLSTILYHTFSPFRHTVIAGIRCTRLMRAVMLDVWDYKQTFAREQALASLGREITDQEVEARSQGRKDCHRRSAERLLEALRTNSGIYVKLGQHVAAVQLLPKEWTSTMTPLQDQCFPTPLEDIDAMLIADMGLGLDDLFTHFNPRPIGVASLAQVHRAVDRHTGREVAVKIQHADLQDFARVDMATVNFAISLVKYVFPDFEFGWLGQEMNEMLPLEMDFRHETSNSARCRKDFLPLQGKTSLYLPEVFWAERRCMVMEFIDGARVDDLKYLKSHKIDRNQVSRELSRIFSQMVYLNGYFHADPHHGNLLIRPKSSRSSSPFNFDVCLLDHGQYFDVPDDLRLNYAHFWLSLIKRSSPQTSKERRYYAKLVGNIDDDMYPILESAITGRLNMSDASNEPDAGVVTRPTSLLDARHLDNAARGKIRSVMAEREGLVQSIFGLLRSVPRRLLMILKLSDLQRSLDESLATTHGGSRVFVIIAQYCAEAVWQADALDFRNTRRRSGLSLHLLTSIASSFLSYAYWRTTLGFAEWTMDTKARAVKAQLWIQGLGRGGLTVADAEMAGLRVL